MGWERLLLVRWRARNAPDQVNERRVVCGHDLAGQLEAAPGIGDLGWSGLVGCLTAVRMPL